MNNRFDQLKHVKNILVIKLKYHGDVLLTSPVFNVLKKNLPNANIDALVYHDTAPMLELNPNIRKIYTLKKRKHGLKNYIQQEIDMIKSFYKTKYDIIIHLDQTMRGAWLSLLLQPKLSVATNRSRSQFIWNKAFKYYNEWIGPNKRHTIETHLDALRMLGIHPDPNDKAMSFSTNSQTQKEVVDLLLQHRIMPKNYIVFHPTSRCFYKCLTVEQNVQLLYKLSDEYHVPILITSAPDKQEKDYISAMIQKLDKSKINRKLIDLSGNLSLKQLGELIRHAKLFVGADSMPMHLASAVQTPTIAFFGPSYDNEWSPWFEQHQMITSDLPCRPCGLEGCGNSQISDCLTRIDISTLKLKQF